MSFYNTYFKKDFPIISFQKISSYSSNCRMALKNKNYDKKVFSNYNHINFWNHDIFTKQYNKRL